MVGTQSKKRLGPHERLDLADFFPSLSSDSSEEHLRDKYTIAIYYKNSWIKKCHRLERGFYVALLDPNPKKEDQGPRAEIYLNETVKEELKDKLRVAAEKGEEPKPDQIHFLLQEMKSKSRHLLGSDYDPIDAFHILHCYHLDLITSGQMTPGEMWGAFKKIKELTESDISLDKEFFIRDEVTLNATYNMYVDGKY